MPKLRSCSRCRGPGPCLWDDSDKRYLCVLCHSAPTDEFFREACPNATVITCELTHAQGDLSKLAKEPS